MIELREQQALARPDVNPEVRSRLNADSARNLGADLAILDHPVRLQIIDILARSDGQVCVYDIEEAVPVKQPTVSHHLKLLREAGLIDCARRGQWAYYFIRRERMAALRARVVAWLDTLA